MEFSKIRIIVDEREKKSGIPDLLKSVGINIEIKTGALVCNISLYCLGCLQERR